MMLKLVACLAFFTTVAHCKCLCAANLFQDKGCSGMESFKNEYWFTVAPKGDGQGVTCLSAPWDYRSSVMVKDCNTWHLIQREAVCEATDNTLTANHECEPYSFEDDKISGMTVNCWVFPDEKDQTPDKPTFIIPPQNTSSTTNHHHSNTNGNTNNSTVWEPEVDFSTNNTYFYSLVWGLVALSIFLLFLFIFCSCKRSTPAPLRQTLLTSEVRRQYPQAQPIPPNYSPWAPVKQSRDPFYPLAQQQPQAYYHFQRDVQL